MKDVIKKIFNLPDNIKKILALVTMIVALIEFCLSFVPIYFQMWLRTSDRNFGTSRGDRTNIFVNQSSIPVVLLAILYLAMLLLTAVVFIMLFLKINNQFTKICSFASIASLLFLIILLICVTTIKKSVYIPDDVGTLSISYKITYTILEYEAEPTISILIILNIAAIILSLITTLNIKQIPFMKVDSHNPISEESGNNDTSKSEQIQEKSTMNTEELVKLKDLLDKGIITQEEFDAKKKKMLGL